MQLRVGSACSAGAIKAIGLSGSVSCTQTLPNQTGTSSPAITLGSGSSQIASESLATGSSYLGLAYPHVVISGTAGAPQRVQVDCTLSVPSSGGTPATITKSLAVDLASDGHSQAGTIPLVLPVSSATSAQIAGVSCTDTGTPAAPAPTVTVDTTINALQTASNS